MADPLAAARNFLNAMERIPSIIDQYKAKNEVLEICLLYTSVFSVYDLSDDNFALSSDYDLLYTELTGATVLYLDEYGV